MASSNSKSQVTDRLYAINQYKKVAWIMKQKMCMQTRLEAKDFRDTLLEHMSVVKKSIAKRARHQRQYDRRVNETRMLMQEGDIDWGKALDADLDAAIKPVNDKELIAEVQMTAEYNVLANGQQHAEQPEFNNKGRVNKDAEQYQVKSPLLDAEFFNMKDMEKVFANATLKNKIKKLNGNSMDTKFAKASILGKPPLQPLRNQLVVRQSNAFKSEGLRISKPRFAFQVDVKNDLSKPFTPHYLPKHREYAFVKPYHVIEPSSYRNNKKESYGSNDMAHNYFIKEVRIKTQERNRNSKPSVMHTTNLQNTTYGSKPKPRSNNQTTRCLHVSKSSCVV
uniref:Uncharacterized protein n=1 Tax=Tanacetum cinerariifolium TaxID=118510 RepID=A0A6L2LF74_TANCI|nr:hypothetical protein [Tanacetum cinerariifolium]